MEWTVHIELTHANPNEVGPIPDCQVKLKLNLRKIWIGGGEGG